jgi:hypothetical protein
MHCIRYRRNVLAHSRLILTSSLSSILATNTLTLVFVLGVDFTQIASLTGYFLLGVGCSAWLISGSARVYGKRHTYVFGAILLVAGSIWGAVGMSSGIGVDE